MTLSVQQEKQKLAEKNAMG